MIGLEVLHAPGEETQEQFKKIAQFMVDNKMSSHTVKAILNSNRFIDYLLNQAKFES